MLHAIFVVGGWALFGAMVFLWLRRAENEREAFANGRGRWLE